MSCRKVLFYQRLSAKQIQAGANVKCPSTGSDSNQAVVEHVNKLIFEIDFDTLKLQVDFDELKARFAECLGSKEVSFCEATYTRKKWKVSKPLTSPLHYQQLLSILASCGRRTALKVFVELPNLNLRDSLRSRKRSLTEDTERDDPRPEKMPRIRPSSSKGEPERNDPSLQQITRPPATSVPDPTSSNQLSHGDATPALVPGSKPELKASLQKPKLEETLPAPTQPASKSKGKRKTLPSSSHPITPTASGLNGPQVDRSHEPALESRPHTPTDRTARAAKARPYRDSSSVEILDSLPSEVNRNAGATRANSGQDRSSVKTPNSMPPTNTGTSRAHGCTLQSSSRPLSAPKPVPLTAVQTVSSAPGKKKVSKETSHAAGSSVTLGQCRLELEINWDGVTLGQAEQFVKSLPPTVWFIINQHRPTRSRAKSKKQTTSCSASHFPSPITIDAAQNRAQKQTGLNVDWKSITVGDLNEFVKKFPPLIWFIIDQHSKK